MNRNCLKKHLTVNVINVSVVLAITMAKYLSDFGYHTGIFEKWHLGRDSSANPVYDGFKEFRGLMGGCMNYFSNIDRNDYSPSKQCKK